MNAATQGVSRIHQERKTCDARRHGDPDLTVQLTVSQPGQMLVALARPTKTQRGRVEHIM